MLKIDTRKMLDQAVPAPADQSPVARGPRPLSAAALAAAAAPIAAAWSPIVVAGTVRIIEFALIALVGLAIYSGYVVPIEGFEWRYAAAILGIAALSMLAFQAADIYQVQ